MERTIEILNCNTIESLPAIHRIMNIPREKPLRVIFSSAIQELRESIGADWKAKLPDFSIGIHMLKPEINISKLISDDEITKHSTFFELCAKDYRKLATHLIYSLASHFDEIIDPENAMHTFGKYKRGRQSGAMGLWKYSLHGSDCRFQNTKTGQTIEVYLLTQLEFGILDPYFFIQFMKTTESYQAMPIEIYEDYPEGYLILEKMVKLGKFEKINTVAGHEKVIIRDRVGVLGNSPNCVF